MKIEKILKSFEGEIIADIKIKKGDYWDKEALYIISQIIEGR